MEVFAALPTLRSDSRRIVRASRDAAIHESRAVLSRHVFPTMLARLRTSARATSVLCIVLSGLLRQPESTDHHVPANALSFHILKTVFRSRAMARRSDSWFNVSSVAASRNLASPEVSKVALPVSFGASLRFLENFLFLPKL